MEKTASKLSVKASHALTWNIEMLYIYIYILYILQVYNWVPEAQANLQPCGIWFDQNLQSPVVSWYRIYALCEIHSSWNVWICFWVTWPTFFQLRLQKYPKLGGAHPCLGSFVALSSMWIFEHWLLQARLSTLQSFLNGCCLFFEEIHWILLVILRFIWLTHVFQIVCCVWHVLMECSCSTVQL